GEGGASAPLPVPWFAFGFIAVVALNSTGIVPASAVEALKTVDNFMLTMAMTALGMNTVFNKFRGMGLGPMYLAVVLFVWLVGGGYLLTKLLIT
ncbi:MAG: YeiH family putative sulfate export transporter, partial [Planctomycetes bacterium]|nr:YeiH family putative sulfate export transporter [Planctomycetota bacterium]